MVHMPEMATLVALTMLATAAGIGLGVVLTVFFWMSGKLKLVPWSLGASLGLASLYVLIWLGSALASHEIVLGLGERKYMCELDCHLAYSVTAVQKLESIKGETSPDPNSEFWAVTVTTEFDESTISARRSREAPLLPNPRFIEVVDKSGQSFKYDEAATQRWGHLGGDTQPFTRSLRPGEAYSIDLVFMLPKDVERPRLLITSDTFVDPFMIGHELTPLHKKVWFALGEE